MKMNVSAMSVFVSFIANYSASNTSLKIFGYPCSLVAMLIFRGPLNTPQPTIFPFPFSSLGGGVKELFCTL